MLRLIFPLICIFARPVFLYVLLYPTFEVLQPRGLRVSIPDEPGIRIFGFHANINKAIGSAEYGQIAGDVFSARNGRWTFEDSQATLTDGDVLHFWIYVQADGMNYKKADQSWTYSSVDDQEIIRDSITVTSRNEISAGNQLLFEDNFDSLQIDTSLWKREIKMPFNPDYEFCVYHHAINQELVKINDGKLFIRPNILEDSYGENATSRGKLQLSRCTSLIPAECVRQATGFLILPPILSARFTTKESFTLRYGKIEIRAKFPEGDWLYPEMWLEPKYSSYGMGYANGRVLLGLSRGNENLINATDASKIYDSRKLDFGVRLGMFPNIREIVVSKTNEFGPRWTHDFHVYTTIWTSDGFTFLVDGQEVGRLSPESWLRETSYATGGRNAPFDQEFYITLGVGAGGVRVFPDDTISSEIPKPWRNSNVKSMLLFWKSRDQWQPSWRRNRGQEAAFVIDYVRVWAI